MCWYLHVAVRAGLCMSFFILLCVITLRQGLSVTRSLPFVLSWHQSLAANPGVIDIYSAMHSFLCECWDSNSHLHVCTASALSPQPSPQLPKLSISLVVGFSSICKSYYIINKSANVSNDCFKRSFWGWVNFLYTFINALDAFIYLVDWLGCFFLLRDVGDGALVLTDAR